MPTGFENRKNKTKASLTPNINSKDITSKFQEYFTQVKDPRVERTRWHSLTDIITIGILAVIAGAQGWEDIEEYGLNKKEWLETFLELPEGIPSPDTFRRVFEKINLTLARKMYSFLKPNDVLLGDRAFCGYADMFTIKKLGCDAVFRKHQSRTTTMQKGKIIGDCDKLVTWYKPKSCPKGLSKDEFDTLPLSITVREIYYYIVIPGFRTQQVSLITTLVDKSSYSTLEIVGLYGKRWDVELDLRHLKTTLGMDVLRCKSPSMVRKEIHVFLLAYNLLRSLMWDAGTTYTTPPLRLSLQGTRHHLINFIPSLIAATSQTRHQIYRTLLKVIAHNTVPERPGRSEPQVRKRRPKIYPLMTKPRHELRKQLQTA